MQNNVVTRKVEEMAEKETKKKTTRKTTAKRMTKKQEEKMQKAMDEIEQDAIEYQKTESVDKNEEFPPVVLPCRGYFREMDRGIDVERLQVALNRVMEVGIEESGVYDDATMKAVELFEQKYGGCVNGRFGETELKAYNKLRGAE